MNYFLLSIGLVTALIATSCNKTVQLSDGKIPGEFAADAKRYTGEFHGEFAGKRNSLKIEIKDRLVILTPQEDLLERDCLSQVGKLRSVDVKGKHKKISLRSARFAFSAEICDSDVKGRDLYITFKTPDSLEASIIKDIVNDYDGGGIHGDDFRLPGTFDDGIAGPNHSTPTQRVVYLIGKFQRRGK